MRSLQSHTVTVDRLREELERFARETLQREFSALREHVDKTVKQEMHFPKRRNSWPSREHSGLTEASSDGGDRSMSARRTFDASATASGRRSHMLDPPPKERASRATVSWATKRGSYPREQEEWFGRNTRRAGATVGRASTRAPEACPDPSYTSLAKEQTFASSATREGLLNERGPGCDEEGDARRQSQNSVVSVRDLTVSPGEGTTDSGTERLQALAEAMTHGHFMDWAIGVLITLNAFTIGWETQYMAGQWSMEVPLLFILVDRAFCACFVMELVLRIAAGRMDFFCGPACGWNMFDMFVILLQLADEGVRAFAQARKRTELGTLRILRLFRLVRLLRLTRMLHLLGGLRMLVVSIGDSLKSLGWTLFLLFAQTYIFGVFLTQLVTDHKVRHSEEREELEELLYFFGSLDRSMLSLFETISEGNHWHEVVKPLMSECGRWLALVFVLYMSFTLFALMNVVTGVFCESAIRTAEEDKRQMLMQQMHELFLEADYDNSGTISYDEFEAHLEDPQMLMYLKAIDVNPDEARHLFTLLDTDDAGEIESQALVNGCLRLQGSAKAIELAAFMQEHKQEHSRLMDHAEIVERSLAFLCDHITNTQRSSQPATRPESPRCMRILGH